MKIVQENNFSGSGSGDPLEMLQVHAGVEAQAALDFADRFGAAGEGVVHVVTGLEVTGFVSELATAELADFVEFDAFGFNFFGNRGHEVVDAAFEGLGIKDDQALVLAAHGEVGLAWTG